MKDIGGLGRGGSNLFERGASGQPTAPVWTVYSQVEHAVLERFHNSPALSGALQGGFFLVKKPLGGCGPGYSNCGTAVPMNAVG